MKRLYTELVQREYRKQDGERNRISNSNVGQIGRIQRLSRRMMAGGWSKSW